MHLERVDPRRDLRMQEDEDASSEQPGENLGGFAVRNVSEFLYAGRPAVIVRTTRLRGPENPVERPEEASKEVQESPA
jgi:hypothetical protein